MKSIFVVLMVGASLCCALPNPIYGEWKRWKAQFQPQYASNTEHTERFEVFATNRRTVLELNKKFGGEPDGARFGLNQFADLTPEEFSQRYLHEIPTDLPRHTFLPQTKKSPKDYPAEKNWADEGAVTPVKNQGSCGSCWAFSVTGNMEGVYKVAHGDLPSLSEQQLVDCEHDCMQYQGEKVCDDGCNGGLMPNAMTYAIREAMTSEAAYPYKGKENKCNYTSGSGKYRFSAWRAVNGTDASMIAALNDVGPLSVGVDASLWQFYMGGVFNLPCGKKLNHGVLVTGYGLKGGKKEYWIIKNSWGASWGEKGYMRLIREKDKCGVDNFVNTIIA